MSFKLYACFFAIFVLVLFSEKSYSQNAIAIADPVDVCGSETIQLHSFLSSTPFENPGSNTNLDQLKVIIHFDEIPDDYQVSIAPLKYDKLFAMGAHLDDGAKDIYSHAFQFFNGGEVEGESYSGLCYTDGCGQAYKFKMSSALYPFNDALIIDLHDPNDPDLSSFYVTWPEISEMCSNGWGIYNHGLSGSAGASDYCLLRARSYTKRMIAQYSNEDTDLDTKLFVNPDGSSDFTSYAMEHGYLAAYRMASDITGYPYYQSAAGWPQNIGEICRHAMSDEYHPLIETADFMYAEGLEGRQGFTSFFNHNVIGNYGDITFENFMQSWQYIADTYGKDGNDAIWMTTEEEIINYLIVKDHLQIHENLTGNTLELTFSGDIRDDMRFYATSLLVGSDVDIENIVVEGASSSSNNIDFNGKGLINLSWDGKRFIPPVVEGSDWVANAEESLNIEDALIAADYIAMVEDVSQRNSLKKRLCDAFESGLPDGYCEGVDDEIIYNWTSEPGGFSSTSPSPQFEVGETTTFTVNITKGGSIFTDQVTVVVNSIPQVEITEITDLICGNQPIQLNATAEYENSLLWSGDGTGTFDNTGAEDAVYTPSDEDILNGSVVLSLKAIGSSCGEDPENEITVNFVQAPLIQLENTGEVCQGEVYSTTAVVGNASDYYWSTNGDGLIEDPNALSLVYTPGVQDIENGQVELELNVQGNGGCDYNLTKTILLIMHKIPTIEAGESQMLCPDQTTIQLNATAQYYDNISWITPGDGEVDNVHILNPVYTPGEEDLVQGFFQLVLEANSVSECGVVVKDTLQVTTVDHISVEAGEDQTICKKDTVFLNGYSPNANQFHWAVSGGSNVGSFHPHTNDTTYFLIDPDYSENLIELWFHGIIPGCSGYYETDTLFINTIPEPVLDAGDDVWYCYNTSSIQLVATCDTDGPYSWASMGAGSFSNEHISNPQYYPTMEEKDSGSAQLICSVPDAELCEGEVVDTVTIYFRPLPEVEIITGPVVCNNGQVQLQAIASDYDSLYWSCSGGGSFNETNNSIVEYTVSEEEQAAAVINVSIKAFTETCNYVAYDEIQIQLLSAASVIMQEDTIFVCSNQQAIQVHGIIVNEEQEILWTANGYGGFDDPTISNPVYFPELSAYLQGFAKLTISASSESPCDEIMQRDLFIVFSEEPVVNAGVDMNYCFGETASFSGVSQNEDSVWWTTSSPGDFLDCNGLQTQFTPLNGVYGTFDFVLHAIGDNVCLGEYTDTVQISWDEAPWIEINQPGTALYPGCSIEISAQYNSDQNPIWLSPQGYNINNMMGDTVMLDLPDPTYASTVTVYAVNNSTGGCNMQVKDTLVLQVNQHPDVSVMADVQTICSTQSSIQLNGIVGDNLPFYWTYTGSGNLYEGYSLNPVYELSEADRSLTHIKFELNTELCENNILKAEEFVFINQGASISLMDDTTYCLGTQLLLAPEVQGYESLFWSCEEGGTFSNPASGHTYFILNQNDYSGQGSVELSLTAYSQTPCDPVEESMLLYINSNTEVEIVTMDLDICANQTQIEVSAQAESASTVLWLSSGTGFFDDEYTLSTFYNLTSQDIQSGEVTLSCVAEGDCDPVSDEIILNIHPMVAINILDDTINLCETQSSVSVSAQTEGSGIIHWSTSGSGSFNQTDLSTCDYTFSMEDVENGFVTLTCAVSGLGCVGNFDSDEVLVSITPKVSVDIDEELIVCLETIATEQLVNYCQNYHSVLWHTNGDGIFGDSSELFTSYSPGESDIIQGGVVLTLQAESIQPCTLGDSESCQVVFYQSPTVILSDCVSSACQGDTIQVVAQTDNCSNVNWYSNTSELCLEELPGYCQYLPNSDDVENGFVEIYVEGVGENGCFGIALDSVLVEINSLPQVPPMPDGFGDLCYGVTSSEFYAVDYNDVLAYEWWIDPPEAGAFDGDVLGSTVTVLWNVNYSGSYSLSVNTVNYCGESDVSESFNGIIHENPNPEIIPSPASIVEVWDTITLSVAQFENSSFTWYPGMEHEQIIEVDSSGHSNWMKKCIVQVTNQFDCVGYDSINVYFDLNLNLQSSIPGKMRCYPNPASSVLNLEFFEFSSDLRVFIYDIKGTKLKEKNISECNPGMLTSFDIHELRDGVYMIHIISENGNYLLKFVKANQ